MATRFVEERERLGFKTANAFAKELGVSQQALSKIERGESVPSGDLLARAARLGVDSQYVLAEKRGGEIDGTLLGMCETAMRQAYLAARPSTKHVGIVRLSALTKVYNDVLTRISPKHDVATAVREATERYIAWLDDPADPGLLERALFREAPSAPERGGHHVSADRGSNAAVGDITIGAPTKGKKR